MSDKRRLSLTNIAASLPIVALVLVATLLVSSDRSEASGRGKPHSPRVGAPHCPIVCGMETNCYPGECYLIGEDLQCGSDDCVTRKACRPNCG